MKKINPIARHIRDLVESGQATLERICVACWVGNKTDHLRYHTLTNIFDRPCVSKYVITMLLAGGIITDKLVKEYDAWVKENGPRRKSKGGRPRKNRPYSVDDEPTILREEDDDQEIPASDEDESPNADEGT